MQDGIIRIIYFVVANLAPCGGFLPQIQINAGPAMGPTYYFKFLSQVDALALAKRMAEEEAKRFVGDWTITVQPKV